MCGIFSSTPPGPINLLIADKVLSGKQFNTTSFLIGIILIDILFALIATWGYYSFLSQTSFGYWLALIGACLLIILGFFNLTESLSKKTPSKKPKKFEKSTYFFKGVLLMISNPGFLAFWVIVANQIDQLAFHDISILRSIPFLFGIGIGDIVWFLLFIKLLKFGTGKMSLNIIHYIRVIISIILIIVGVFTLYQTLNG